MILGYIFGSLAVAAALTFASRFINDKKMTLVRKCAALLLGVISLCRSLIHHEAIFSVRGLNMYSPFGNNIPQTVLAVLLVWFTYAALLTIILDQFFEFKTLRNIARYFAAPIVIADLICFNTYAIAIVGNTVWEAFDFRLPLISAEFALALSIVASKIKKNDEFVPHGKEWASLVSCIPMSLLAVMPSYVPQALLGWDKSGAKINGLSASHRLAIYLAFIIPFVIFHILKDKPIKVKRLFVIYVSLGMLWSFFAAHPIQTWLEAANWPLHLCSFAMFAIPVCLIFNFDKFCYFGLYVSVVGSLFMMLFPKVDPTTNAFATEQIAFWVNHYSVFSLPLLIVALNIFKRPKFKDWLYSTAIFTVYFVITLIANVWLVNYWSDVDFFFLNSNFIVEKLGDWAISIKNIAFSFNAGNLTFTLYPVYYVLYYIGYVAISAVMWLCFRFLFKTWDDAEARRLKERDYKQMKKDLKKFFSEKNAKSGDGLDRKPSVVLNQFSKKYGKNKHYSVDHVSFKVEGGEIFGFLGPNGAGKSTIIKSIVGIQTITSGNIEICGYDVERESVQAKLNTGFVPDHYALYENLTGREYINYIADLYDVKDDKRNEVIEKYVTRFQLTHSFDNQMKTYSHGMKQKIAIMAALVHDPKVWILDEPLTGLDPTSIHEVKECMKEHAAKGNIVFFSSHIIDVVEKICDKIAIIKKGKLRAAATVSELDARGIDLEQFYLDIIAADENADLISIDGESILNVSGTTSSSGN